MYTVCVVCIDADRPRHTVCPLPCPYGTAWRCPCQQDKAHGACCMHHTGEPHPLMAMLLALPLPCTGIACWQFPRSGLPCGFVTASLPICAYSQFLCHINLGINSQSDESAILQTAAHPCSKPTTGPIPHGVVRHKI